MTEKPAQALLKILRDNDRAINPSPPDLQSLGLKYDAELSALVSPEYLGFVLSRPRRAGDLFYLYSKRKRFYDEFGEEWTSYWGEWQKRNLGKDRNKAAVMIASENLDYESERDMDRDACIQLIPEWFLDERISGNEEWYRNKFKILPEIKTISVISAFSSAYDAVLFLANGHAMIWQQDPEEVLYQWRKRHGFTPQYCTECIIGLFCSSLPEALAKCYQNPTFDPDLLAQWKGGYPIRCIAQAQIIFEAMEQAIELEKRLYIESGRPDQFPILER